MLTTEQPQSQTSPPPGPPLKPQVYLTGMKLVACFIALVFCMFLTAIDQTITSTAIKGLEDSFHEFSLIGWTSSAYMLPAATFSLLWGRLGLIFGRKACILTAVFLFGLGSLIAALSPNMNAFIISRAITGIGAAGIQTSGFLIVSEITPIEKRGLLISIFTLAMVPATVIAPLIGGAFTNSPSLTWRWCFYINLPFGGVAVAAMWFFYRPLQSGNNLLTGEIDWKDWPNCVLMFFKSLDLPGLGLLSFSWVLFFVGLSLGGNQYPWKSATVICLVTIGGLTVIAGFVYELGFLKYNKYDDNDDRTVLPVLPRHWIAIRGVIFPCLCIFCSSMAFFAMLMYISIYFEIVLDKSAFSAGVHLLPVIISSVPSSLTGGILSSKKGIMKPSLIVGGSFLSIGCGLVSMLNADTKLGPQIGYLIFLGLGFGLSAQPAMISAQMTVPGDTVLRKLVVTAFMAYCRNLGSSAGGIVATAVYTAVANMQLQTSGSFGSRPNINNALKDMDTFTLAQKHVLQLSLVQALHAVFWFSLAMSILAVICALLVPNDSNYRHNDKGNGKGSDMVEDSQPALKQQVSESKPDDIDAEKLAATIPARP